MLTQQQLADKIKCSLRTVARMDEQTQEAWQLLAEQGKVYGYQDLIAALVFECDVFNLKFGPHRICKLNFRIKDGLASKVDGVTLSDQFKALAYLKEQNYAK